ncbi:MAG: hypothetical protein ACRDCK_08175, partial [Plesiomonas shigelloides]
RSLLLLLVRLHDAVQSLYEQQQSQTAQWSDADIAVRIAQLQQWAERFPYRHHHDHEIDNMEGDITGLLVGPYTPCWRLAMVDRDITQLTNWLKHQQPFLV